MGKLRFVFGPSGSGKTTTIYRELLLRAAKEPHRNFLIIVPDQFTMQTQWDISNTKIDGASGGGIMNIDVLSFGRLHHRIMKEVGWKELPVLDDTGKCLVLQRVAGRIAEQLPLLGSRLRRQGYIHEIKSILSEFMQYGIAPGDIDRILEANKDKGALCTKLTDLQRIYREFQEYLAGNYITREEKLDVLRQAMPKSAILPGSVVVFDGFTGFTPIQANVVEDIMSIADETIVSLVLGTECSIEDTCDEQHLFHLSGKTYRDILARADRNSVTHDEDIYCSNSVRIPMIEHIEKNLFRAGSRSYIAENDGVGENTGFTMSQMSTVPEEVHQVGLKICRMLKDNPGLQYRNIVLVTGDPETYSPYIEREFSCLGIPYFLDRTSGIRLNPLVEAIRSSLSIYTDNFSADSVIRYLRSGLSGFWSEDVDRLDIYIRKCGIRGRKKWNSPFVRRTDDMPASDDGALDRLNAVREKLMNQLEVLNIKSKDTAANYVNNLYDFLISVDAAGQLRKYADEFEADGDPVREREYSQIYKKVMELLEQVISLMGEDELSIREFYEIIDAGFGEIRVGTIPQTVDKVMVGDIERSRVPSVAAMFFLGVNDGNIPGNTDKGGILSDIDRENLRDTNFELAPTPREAMYSQRMYLYLNMTKPVYSLNISWAGIDPSGKSLRPSYICEILKKMFPGIKVEQPENKPVTEQIFSAGEGVRYLSGSLRRFAEVGEADGENDIYTLYEAYSGEASEAIRNRLEEAAFIRYKPELLDEFVAEQLYCRNVQDGDADDRSEALLNSSVSQLETFGKCPYRFFLRYGLRLKESTEYVAGNRDKGNVYHQVLQDFSESLKKDGVTWRDMTESYARDRIHDITARVTEEYGQAVYQDSERSKYSVKKLEKALLCTVLALKYQISKGKFEPYGFEVPFEQSFDMKAGANGRKRRLILKGKIDRIDKASGQQGDMIRVVDYKSSENKLDLNKVYDGRQLQLALYTGQAAQKENAMPAAMLYYHVDNPVLENVPEEPVEELNSRRMKALKMAGIVASDPEVVGLNDSDLADGSGVSDVIPVGYKKDGFTAGSSILSGENINAVIDYAREIAKEKAGDILDGCVRTMPIDEANTCEYCEFKKSCGFDRKIPGYEKRVIQKHDKDEVIELMRERLSGN